MINPEPPRDCPLCPRLVAYRGVNRAENPDWWNGPAPSFGDPNARLLIVGLAPGRTGANRTGRPFTGDGAGWILYETLLKTGFATGVYEADPNDSLQLRDCMITNAVRCAPPLNKPTTDEENTCRPFLISRLEALPNLKAILTLGDVSRRNVLKSLGFKASAGQPGHGTAFDTARCRLFTRYDGSWHNKIRGRGPPAMFEGVLENIGGHRGG